MADGPLAKTKYHKGGPSDELRGRGGDDPPSARIWVTTVVTHRQSYTHSGSGPRPLGQSATHTRPHPLRVRQPVRFNRSAHTPAAPTRNSPRGGLRPITVGSSAPAGTPPSSGQTLGSSPGQPDHEQSYSMRNITHTRTRHGSAPALVWRWRWRHLRGRSEHLNSTAKRL
jgi:hypothetical protein